MNDERILSGRTVLITGAARRLGRAMAIAVAKEGANVVIHYGKSKVDAEEVANSVQTYGSKAWVFGCDLDNLLEVESFMDDVFKETSVDALINNAAIFENLNIYETDLHAWQTHIDIIFSAAFILSKNYSKNYEKNDGRIVNILDWRALRPGKDHFAYTMAKAGLAAMTESLALTFAPRISVNGIALGAILPAKDNANDMNIIKDIPLVRWASISEVTETLIFLLSGSGYITGEIIHVDGGKHIS
jgi:NAD(P)-dependent dehydrogenase (short-subunit alcohol dehydrogenase family)